MQTPCSCIDYISPSGRAPVREFMRELSAHDQECVLAGIKAARCMWPRTDGERIKKVEKGLWEVRMHILGGIARVLFTSHGAGIVLLHGLVKKAPRLTERDKATARARRADFLSRKE